MIPLDILQAPYYQYRRNVPQSVDNSRRCCKWVKTGTCNG
jgi:hypothetical protein